MDVYHQPLLFLFHLSLLTLLPVYVGGASNTGDDLDMTFVTLFISLEGDRAQHPACQECEVAARNNQPLPDSCKTWCIKAGDIKGEVPMYKMMFESARRSHPGCKTVLLTDSNTQVDPQWAASPGARVFRTTDRITRKEVVSARCRLWVEFVGDLIDRGESSHLVFIDDDILVVGDLSHIFAMRLGSNGNIYPGGSSEDAGLPFPMSFTYRLNDARMPINTGIIFAHGGDLPAVRRLVEQLRDLALHSYDRADFWCTDQYAARDVLNVKTIYEAAKRQEVFPENSLKHTVGGKEKVNVLLLPVEKYNWYHIYEQTLKTVEEYDARVIHYKDGLKKYMFPTWTNLVAGKGVYEALKASWDESHALS